MNKLILKEKDCGSTKAFKQIFKKMLGIDYDEWEKNATTQADEEWCDWTDGRITVGCTAYELRKVFINDQIPLKL